MFAGKVFAYTFRSKLVVSIIWLQGGIVSFTKIVSGEQTIYAICFQALFKLYFFLNLPLTHMITKGCLSDFREGDFPLPLKMMVVGSPRFISL